MELASLQTLGDEKKAGAVPEQSFDGVAATVKEQEEVSTHRILAQSISD